MYTHAYALYNFTQIDTHIFQLFFERMSIKVHWVSSSQVEFVTKHTGKCDQPNTDDMLGPEAMIDGSTDIYWPTRSAAKCEAHMQAICGNSIFFSILMIQSSQSGTFQSKAPTTRAAFDGPWFHVNAQIPPT